MITHGSNAAQATGRSRFGAHTRLAGDGAIAMAVGGVFLLPEFTMVLIAGKRTGLPLCSRPKISPKGVMQ